MAVLKVSVVAADHEVWSGEASMVVARTVEGQIGILPGHEPLLAILATGTKGRDLFPGGRSLNDAGGWPTVVGIYTIFFALAYTGWAAEADSPAGRGPEGRGPGRSVALGSVTGRSQRTPSSRPRRHRAARRHVRLRSRRTCPAFALARGPGSPRRRRRPGRHRGRYQSARAGVSRSPDQPFDPTWAVRNTAAALAARRSHNWSRSCDRMTDQCSHGVGQRVRLVALPAVRMRGQERRVGLHHQQTRPGTKRAASARSRALRKLTGPANDRW